MASHQCNQFVDSRCRNLVDRLDDARERRLDQLVNRRAVESDDHHVVGYADPASSEHPHCSDSHFVVARKNSIDTETVQLGTSTSTRESVEGTVDNQLLVDLPTGAFVSEPESGKANPCVAAVERASDTPDAPTTLLEQVRRRPSTRFEIFDIDTR